VVANPALPINEAMAEFIAESDLGPDVAYHLGKNPGVAARIHALSPVKAALALEEIAREIAAKPQPKPSNAPAPIKPIGAASASTKSPADMTDAEYAKWRKKGRA
jgi:cell pole-organizing protein PopZ